MGLTLINYIESKPGVCGGKPCIAGTHIRVREIYVWHEHSRNAGTATHRGPFSFRLTWVT
jgi:uncharacterized protein (DUF433 family)